MVEPVDQIYREAAFIAYYFHWSLKEILELEHDQRRRWCEEISRINRELSSADNGESGRRNIFDV